MPLPSYAARKLKLPESEPASINPLPLASLKAGQVVGIHLPFRE